MQSVQTFEGAKSDVARLRIELVEFEKRIKDLRELLHRTELEFLSLNSESPVFQEDRLVARIADLFSRLGDAKESSRERIGYVREGEAAKYMGVTVSTLRSWRTKRSKNSPPYTRLGRMVMYPVADLEGHMKARMVPARD